jgi:hypothetical protein
LTLVLRLKDDFPVVSIKLSRLLNESRPLSLLCPINPERRCSCKLESGIDSNIHRPEISFVFQSTYPSFRVVILISTAGGEMSWTLQLEGSMTPPLHSPVRSWSVYTPGSETVINSFFLASFSE